MKVKEGTNLVTVGPVRFKWLEVFKPRLNTVKTPPVEEYSVTIMFPKEDNEIKINAKEEIDAFKAYLKAVSEEKFGKTLPKGFKQPLKDGDAEGEHESNNGYFTMRLSKSAERPPKTIDGNRNLIGPGSGWKSGDWGFVQMSIFTYDKVGKGITAGLEAIQFTRKGEPLGGESVDLDEFDTFEGSEQEEDGYDPFKDE